MQFSWILDKNDYLDVLKEMLKQHQSIRGYRSQLALAMGCQPAYLSHVLSGSAHMTPDHAIAASDFWGFDDLEREYFMLLLSRDRAATQKLQKFYQNQISILAVKIRRQLKSKVSLESETVSKELVIKYYLDWVPSAIHMALTLKGSHDYRSLAQFLKIKEVQAIKGLAVLKELGLVVENRGKLVLTQKKMHADDASEYAHLHQKNWRQQAVVKFENGVQKPDFQFTGVASIDEKTFTQIRTILKEVTEKSKQKIQTAPEEIIACLNLDWFIVGAE